MTNVGIGIFLEKVEKVNVVTYLCGLQDLLEEQESDQDYSFSKYMTLFQMKN